MPHAEGVLKAARESGKPFVTNFIPNQIVKSSVQFLKENGVPNYPSGEKAMAALAKMAQYNRLQKKLAGRESLSGLFQQVSLETPQSLPQGKILEPAAMRWLERHSCAGPPFCPQPRRAKGSLREIGFPLVLKVVSPQILHKSDFGGVKVNLQNEAQALEAYNAILEKTRAYDFQGVMVYPMVSGGLEVLVGLSTDAQFGPVVAVGLGGIYTEVWRDISLRIAPIDQATAMEMIEELKSVKILRGVRGNPPRDIPALADLLVKFSTLPF